MTMTARTIVCLAKWQLQQLKMICGQFGLLRVEGNAHAEKMAKRQVTVGIVNGMHFRLNDNGGFEASDNGP